ncbi:MAG TPA: glycosyltransferase family 4 protein [Candidatus Gastranaerophilales bacterium]|nr:glycosyltransferase family 4 protein [Candidatus Gastranaerophilales bacterium]
MDKTKLNVISQVYYPDIAATGELLHELLSSLSQKYNYEITVLTAQPNFAVKNKRPAKEIIDGIKIKRLFTTGFNKNSFIGKVLNSWLFFFNALINSLFLSKADYCLIVTFPPLAPLIGTINRFLRNQKYIYLMHDVYPEIAWKLGYIKKDGIICKIWHYLTGISLKYANKIIVLSEDMKTGVLKRFPDIKNKEIAIMHNWANEELLKVIPKQNNHLIDKFGLKDKFIVEYSGNIGRIHEFNTIIEAARLLQEEKDILFLFIGEGGKKTEVEKLVKKHQLQNFKFLPFQKKEILEYSLGLGDVHLITLDAGYEELSAPSKLYGILAAAKPVIFVGSAEIYITGLIENANCGKNIKKGDYEALKNLILELKSSREKLLEMSFSSRKLFEENFTFSIICKKYHELLSIPIQISFR